MMPIDLSDGTHLPPGANLLTPMAGISFDKRYFPDPEAFDGLRFWRKLPHQQQQQSSGLPRSSSPSPTRPPSVTITTSSSPPQAPSCPTTLSTVGNHQFTSTGDLSQNFGLEKHAFPGRFFAAQVIKVFLVYLLLNYDIKLRVGESRPQPVVFTMTKGPSQTTEVLFRRRGTAAESADH